MEWAALLAISGLCVAGSIGLRLYRQTLLTHAHGVEQLAAAGLMEALAKSGPLSGVSPVALARTRALCACALIPDRSKLPGLIRGS